MQLKDAEKVIEEHTNWLPHTKWPNLKTYMSNIIQTKEIRL